MNTGRRYDYRFRNKVHIMRLKGMSYGQIREKTGISKSTLSYWLKDIELTPEQKSLLYTERIRKLATGPNSQRERRKREIDRIIKNARKEVRVPISDESFRLIGAALYWAEGTKTGMFQVTNSDPLLILFMVKWIERIIGIPAKKLRARLNIYPQQNENEIKRFWSHLTKIPVDNFGKSYVKPVSSGYKKNNLYFGTIKIEIPKSSDQIHRTFAWIQVAIREIAPRARITRKRWKTLEKTKRPVNL